MWGNKKVGTKHYLYYKVRKARMRHGEKPNENGTRKLDSQQKQIEIGYSPTVPIREQQEERNNCNVLYKNLY